MNNEAKTLFTIAKPYPALSPTDSIYRAAHLFRTYSTQTLPVTNENDRILGILRLSSISSVLTAGDSLADMTISQLMEPLEIFLHTEDNTETAMRLFRESGETTIFIADHHGFLHGGLSLTDMIDPTYNPVRPPSAGGLAIPWGVYLTSGELQAGQSNFNLFLGGISIGLIFTISRFLVELFCGIAQSFTHFNAWTIWNSAQPAQLQWNNLNWYFIQLSPLIIFGIILRLSPLAGYHGAEHKSVHALERGEPLHPSIVRAMPCVHPRCGTNFVAAAMIFGGIYQALVSLRLGFDSMDAAMVGGIVALFTWRSFGAFLQKYITTREPNEKQLLSGIKAAQELERKYQTTPFRRSNLFRKIWCMGMPQSLLGLMLGVTVFGYLSDSLLGLFIK